jgi:hypothetical protein
MFKFYIIMFNMIVLNLFNAQVIQVMVHAKSFIVFIAQEAQLVERNSEDV